MFKHLTLLLFVLFLSSCSSVTTSSSNTLVLLYSDFGPQAMAYETIGYEWWQWGSSGNSEYEKNDIKVVVYKDISLSSVENLYPVNPDKKIDYRYLDYKSALLYLDKSIEENVLPELTMTLEATKAKLNESLE